MGDGIVEGQRAVKDGAADLAAISHLAQGGGIDGGRDVGADGFHGRQDGHLWCLDAKHAGGVDGVLGDVDLGFQVGRDVDGGIGDEEVTRVAFHLHDENVADAAVGADALVAVQRCTHEFIGMQAAFHQGLGFAVADQFDGTFGCRMAVLDIFDAIARQVDVT